MGELLVLCLIGDVESVLSAVFTTEVEREVVFVWSGLLACCPVVVLMSVVLILRVVFRDVIAVADSPH